MNPMASRDVDDEFREIKREIIESRGLVIKTHNATNALAADVKAAIIYSLQWRQCN